jgi:hypothetical protein
MSSGLKLPTRKELTMPKIATFTYNDGSNMLHKRSVDVECVIGVVENRTPRPDVKNNLYIYCTLFTGFGVSIRVEGTHDEVTKILGWSE